MTENEVGGRTAGGSHTEEDSLDQLYRIVIFDHYKRPRNKGVLHDAQIVTKGNNPVCGDRVTVFGMVDAGGKLRRVQFDGKGCAICMASASMMTAALQGKTLDEAGKLCDDFKGMMRSDVPFVAPPEVPDMDALEGVRKFSVRIKCATLPWTTFKNGMIAYQAGEKGDTSTQVSCALPNKEG